MTLLSLAQTALELGLISSITAVSLFISYLMLGVCDLSTDGCFTLGAAVGASVALMGFPYLSLVCAVICGMLSGFITALLQTKMGINSLLSGIIVNTGLYSVNMAVMGGASLLNLNQKDTVFTDVRSLLEKICPPLAPYYKLVVALIFCAVISVLAVLFLRTRLGLAIRATGNNPEMLKSSSVNPAVTTVIGLSISGGITALSGCLLAQSQKSVNIDVGTGMLTVALASLLIGETLFSKRKIGLRMFGMALGAFIFRFVYTVALRFKMPAYMLKLVSAVIVAVAISLPYIKSSFPQWIKRMKRGGKENG